MKSNKRKWFVSIAVSLLLFGCSNSEENLDTTERENTKSSEEASKQYKVVDDRGMEITFNSVPETVVSLRPSNTEILFELGVGDKIIGANEYDNYPEEALEIERVADISTVNNERIVELNPDVVFAYTSGGEAQIEQLESAGIKVFVIQAASSIEDIYDDIQQIANVMGEKEKGEQIVEGIQQQIVAVQEKTATIDERKKVYFEIASAPDIWSIGSGTYQQELIEAAGVENIYADQQGWFAVTEEDIINRNPKVIATTVNVTEDPVGEILSRAGWSSITAIQNEDVYLLNPDIIDRPGPRIGQAVEMIAETIYPELFTK